MTSQRLRRYSETLEMVEAVETKLIDSSKFFMRKELGDISLLKSSIKEKGLLQPIIVRPAEKMFDLIAGHRRFEACRQLRWFAIPCLVKNLDDREAFEISLVENVQRQTLDPIEEATAFKQYISNYGWGGITYLGKKIGKSEQYISHRILLLDLPKPVIDKITRRQVNPSAASELIWLNNSENQQLMAEEAAKKSLTVRQIRQATKFIRNGASVPEVVQLIVNENPSEDDQSDQGIKTIRQTLLTLRMCLLRLDAILSKVDNDMRDFIFTIRFEIHELVDECLRYLNSSYNQDTSRVDS